MELIILSRGIKIKELCRDVAKSLIPPWNRRGIPKAANRFSYCLIWFLDKDIK